LKAQALMNKFILQQKLFGSSAAFFISLCNARFQQFFIYKFSFRWDFEIYVHIMSWPAPAAALPNGIIALLDK